MRDGRSAHLPTSTRVASRSWGLFPSIPDDECPSALPSPCRKEGGEGSPLATLDPGHWSSPPRLPYPLSFRTMFRLGAFRLSSHTPGTASPVHRRALSPARDAVGAEAVKGPQNVSGLQASHSPGPPHLWRGCRTTHRGHGLSRLLSLGCQQSGDPWWEGHGTCQ